MILNSLEQVGATVWEQWEEALLVEATERRGGTEMAAQPIMFILTLLPHTLAPLPALCPYPSHP